MADERQLTAEPADALESPGTASAVIRGSALRTGGYLLGILLGLVSVPLLTRHLGVADFGRFVLVMSLVTLVGGLTEGGLTAISTREYIVRGGEDRDHLMRRLLGLRLLLTTAGIAAALAFAVIAGYDEVLVLGVLLAGTGLLIQVAQTLLTAPLTASLRFGWVTTAELVRQVLNVLAIAALVLAGAGLLPFFAAAIPAALASSVFTIRLVRGLVPLRPAIDPRASWALLRETLPFAIALAINVTYFRVALIVMSLQATELETGYFATSYRVMEVLLGIPGVLLTAAFPVMAHAAEADRTRLAYTVSRALEVSLILGVWMLVCLELGAGFVIDVVAGAQAEPAVDVLRLQAPAVVATFVAFTGGYALLSLRRHRVILLANLAALAAAVGMALLLVPAHAARGAAVATVIAEFALAGAVVVALIRAGTGLRLSGRVAAPIVVAGGVAACAAFIPAHEVVRVAVATLAYLGVLAALRAFPPEVIHTFRLGGLLRWRG